MIVGHRCCLDDTDDPRSCSIGSAIHWQGRTAVEQGGVTWGDSLLSEVRGRGGIWRISTMSSGICRITTISDPAASGGSCRGLSMPG